MAKGVTRGGTAVLPARSAGCSGLGSMSGSPLRQDDHHGCFPVESAALGARIAARGRDLGAGGARVRDSMVYEPAARPPPAFSCLDVTDRAHWSRLGVNRASQPVGRYRRRQRRYLAGTLTEYAEICRCSSGYSH